MIKKSKLPTNLTTNNHSIHRWMNFIAGFSPEFVEYCIDQASFRDGGLVLDPFSGLATTSVEANKRNIPSVGYEPNNFFYDLSVGKLNGPSININKLHDFFISIEPISIKNFWSEDAEKFLKKLFSEEALGYIASIVEKENQFKGTENGLYKLTGSAIAEKLTHSQTDGIYKAPSSKKKAFNYQDSVKSIFNPIKEDVNELGSGYKNLATIYNKSSEVMSEVKDSSCSLIVTSPPYLNNFDYAEMVRMQFYIWKYANSWGDITRKFRTKFITNTTTAPADIKNAQDKFRKATPESLYQELDELVNKLEIQKNNHAGRKDYYKLVYPYFGQMNSVIKESFRVLHYNGDLHLVVADSALYGIHIDTEKILGKLMEEAGFKVNEIIHLRDRGDRWILKKRKGSSKGLGEYHIWATKLN